MFLLINEIIINVRYVRYRFSTCSKVIEPLSVFKNNNQTGLNYLPILKITLTFQTKIDFKNDLKMNKKNESLQCPFTIRNIQSLLFL